jgi:diguanylate cyclase (GGDEF)-like protein/PAS domain S-box-containing protein
MVVDALINDAEGNPELEAQAKQQALSFLSAQRVGPAGYFFVVDREGTVIMHPEPELVGANLSQEDVIQKVFDQGHGYIRYRWQNPSDSAPAPKTGYVVHLDEWGWYATASDYTEGFLERLSPMRLQDLVTSIDLPNVLAISLKSTDGEPLAETARWDEVSRQYGLGMAAHGETDSRVGSGNAIQVFLPVDRFDATVGVIYTPDVLYDVLERYLVGALLALIPAALLIYVLSRVSATLITAPIVRFTERFHRRVDPDGPADVRHSTDNDLGAMVLTQLRTLVRLDYEEKRRRVAEQSLVVSRQVFLNTAEGIVVTDPDGIISEVNPAFTKMTGYESTDIVGEPASVLQSDEHDSVFFSELWRSLIDVGSWSGEIWNRRKDGTAVPQLCSIEAVQSGRGTGVESYVAVYHDISEIKSTQQRLHHLANHDPLTGLPNRSFLTDMLGYSIAQAKREGRRLAVLFVDLDHFKDVNDSFGHDTGDRLLTWISEKLRGELREEDMIARFGGDEFVIVIPDVSDTEDVALVARRLLASVREPYVIREQRIRPSLSIGIAVYPDGSLEQADLLRDADAAMYAAKHAGRNDYRFHDPAMNDVAHRRLAMQGAVARGLDEGEFSVVYQPIIGLKTDAIVGAEALVRWDGSPNPVPPDEFLPFLENSSMITRLDLWVLEEACAELATHLEELPEGFYLSVNTGAANLLVDDYVERVTQAVRVAGIDPSRISIEVTETAAIKNFARARRTLQALRSHGFSIYLDDFGAGHASIRYLREFGIDAVKLDRQFINEVESSESAQSLVSGFVSLARGMNLTTIIEGVETQEQLDYVRSANADCVQGFFCSKPMQFHELMASSFLTE